MNHFFLWVGPPGETERQGHALLPHVKNVGPLFSHRQDGWALVWASQADGAGAFADSRFRGDTSLGRRRALAWFGHAWCDEGPLASMRALADAADKPAARSLEELREATDGVYAAVVVDAVRGEIAIGSDMLGTFHVYYRQFKDGVALANSSALLAALLPAASLDPIGVQEFCSLAVANEDRTLWGEVRKLRGECILSMDIASRRLTMRRHRPLLAELQNVDRDLEASVSGLGGALETVLRRLRRYGNEGSGADERPWAADLTGGNDSRALMAALLHNRVDVAATVSGADDHEDVVIGRRLASVAGIPFIRRPPQGPIGFEAMADALALTDGEFDAVEFAAIADVHRSHRRDGLLFSVNGSYGETGRGYPWRLGPKAVFFPDRMARALLARAPIDAGAQGRDRFRPIAPGSLFSPDAQVDWSTHAAGMIGRLLEYSQGLPRCAQLDLIHIDLRMERWQGRIASATNQLWPAISPWGLREVLPRLLTASPLARRNSLLTRAFTARYAPALADELLFTGNPARPFDWRHSAKFIPAIGWYMGRARQKLAARLSSPPPASLPSAALRQPALCSHVEIRQMLLDPALAATGLFQREALATALEPKPPRSDVAYTLWRRLVTLEATWRRHRRLSAL